MSNPNNMKMTKVNMTKEDSIVDVDGYSTTDESAKESGEESDVEDFDQLGGACGGGGKGHSTKKTHHNELERKRRQELSRSHLWLRKRVLRLFPKSKSTVKGRDSVLELSNMAMIKMYKKSELINSSVREIEAAAKYLWPKMSAEEKEKMQELLGYMKEKCPAHGPHPLVCSPQEASTSSQEPSYKDVQSSSDSD